MIACTESKITDFASKEKKCVKKGGERLYSSAKNNLLQIIFKSNTELGCKYSVKVLINKSKHSNCSLKILGGGGGGGVH